MVFLSCLCFRLCGHCVERNSKNLRIILSLFKEDSAVELKCVFIGIDGGGSMISGVSFHLK